MSGNIFQGGGGGGGGPTPNDKIHLKIPFYLLEPLPKRCKQLIARSSISDGILFILFSFFFIVSFDCSLNYAI